MRVALEHGGAARHLDDHADVRADVRHLEGLASNAKAQGFVEASRSGSSVAPEEPSSEPSDVVEARANEGFSEASSSDLVCRRHASQTKARVARPARLGWRWLAIEGRNPY